MLNHHLFLEFSFVHSQQSNRLVRPHSTSSDCLLPEGRLVCARTYTVRRRSLDDIHFCLPSAYHELDVSGGMVYDLFTKPPNERVTSAYLTKLDKAHGD